MSTLYVSHKCDYCTELMKICPNNVTTINVHNAQQLPGTVKSVPTLITSDGEVFYGYIKIKSLFGEEVLPFGFMQTNNMNNGFSFIDSEVPFYSENANYTYIE